MGIRKKEKGQKYSLCLCVQSIDVTQSCSTSPPDLQESMVIKPFSGPHLLLVGRTASLHLECMRHYGNKADRACPALQGVTAWCPRQLCNCSTEGHALRGLSKVLREQINLPACLGQLQRRGAASKRLKE